ncbi:ABC transporter ATP-binding protein [Eisenbergiella sp.]
MKRLQSDKDSRQKAGRQPEGQHFPIVLTRELVKYYGSGENLVRAIDHTTLDLQRGEFTAIVGRSGSGKSTLLHMLGGLDRPDSGKVLIEGQDISSLKDEELARFRRRKIGFIFQDYNLVPSLNVWENIVLPIGLDGKKADKELVSSIVERIGIQDKLRALPNTLSGGQQQRVAIARALAARPAIILADEPTGNLDSKTELEVIALLKSCVNDYCQTLVVITHDETIAQMADRILVIEDGKVVSE